MARATNSYKPIDHAVDVSKLREQVNEQTTENRPKLPEAVQQQFSRKVDSSDSNIKLPEVQNHGFRIRSTGNVETDDLGGRAVVANENDITFVSFEYRLIPEATWDVQLSDAQYAVKWLWEKAKSLGGDVSKGFIVGGSIAGAHLAATSVIRARSLYPQIKITRQMTTVPVVMSWTNLDKVPKEWKEIVTSHEENANVPILNEEDYQQYLHALNIPDSEIRKAENFPIWADFKGFPPAYLAMDGPDPIRDEGYLLEKKLREAGVMTRFDHYELPNWFVQFPELSSTVRAPIELSAGVRWLLDFGRFALQWKQAVRRYDTVGMDDIQKSLLLS